MSVEKGKIINELYGPHLTVNLETHLLRKLTDGVKSTFHLSGKILGMHNERRPDELGDDFAITLEGRSP